jgi:hypothetical protein
MENVETLAAEGNLITFLMVLVALAGLFILLSNVVEAWRKLKKPQDVRVDELQRHQDICGRRFASDKKELDDHADRIRMLEEGQCVMCEALHELLEHELHNGNADQMHAVSGKLFKYLNTRRNGG